MQKVATRIFISASLLFGVLGVVMVLTGLEPDEKNTGLSLVITRVFMADIFVILSSFALSVAGKYLGGKS